jgi:hypothetical protein
MHIQQGERTRGEKAMRVGRVPATRSSSLSVLEGGRINRGERARRGTSFENLPFSLGGCSSFCWPLLASTVWWILALLAATSYSLISHRATRWSSPSCLPFLFERGSLALCAACYVYYVQKELPHRLANHCNA